MEISLLFDKHRESKEFVNAIAKACSKRTSSCYIYEYDEEKTYEYRFILKSIIAEPDHWQYELECYNLDANKFVYLQICSFDRVCYYYASTFTSKIVDQLSSLTGAWLRMTQEIKDSVGNIAIFTAHRTFRLKSNKSYGLNIPFIHESRELIYIDDDYNGICFHVINGQLKEANQSLIPLNTSVFEVK